MRIYIRHGPKEYKNGDSSELKHDPGLTEQGKFESQKCGGRLLKKYGLPSFIVCSPYKRARETAQEMLEGIAFIFRKNKLNYDKSKAPKIIIDTDLSEYLGNHYSETLDVSPETGKYNPPHPESFRDFCARIKHHNEKYSYLDNGTEPLVWFISHGIVIDFIKKQFGGVFRPNYKLNYLEYVHTYQWKFFQHQNMI